MVTCSVDVDITAFCGSGGRCVGVMVVVDGVVCLKACC